MASYHTREYQTRRVPIDSRSRLIPVGFNTNEVKLFEHMPVQVSHDFFEPTRTREAMHAITILGLTGVRGFALGSREFVLPGEQTVVEIHAFSGGGGFRTELVTDDGHLLAVPSYEFFVPVPGIGIFPTSFPDAIYEGAAKLTDQMPGIYDQARLSLSPPTATLL